MAAKIISAFAALIVGCVKYGFGSIIIMLAVIATLTNYLIFLPLTAYQFIKEQ